MIEAFNRASRIDVGNIFFRDMTVIKMPFFILKRLIEKILQMKDFEEEKKI